MQTCWFPGVVLLIVNVVAVNLAVNPACECVVYQSYGQSSGSFHSPNFPDSYSRGLDCILFTFIGDVDEIVELTFIEFDLKWHSAGGGCGDYLRLFLNIDRPEVDEHSRWDRELCGNISRLDQKTYYSKGRSLIFEFHSDNERGEIKHTGFRGKFKFLDASQFATMCQKILGTPCTFTCHHYPNQSNSNRFFSPRYPQNYPKSASCEYKFHAEQDEKVKVSFQNIQLYNKNDSPCNKTQDLIDVYDGENTDSQLVRTLCGVSNHETVTSSGRHLYIRFTSDDVNEQKGFAATYEFLPKHITSRGTINPLGINNDGNDDGNISNCNENKSSEGKQEGFVQSRNFPGRYTSSTQCQYTFRGSPNERIQIEFTHMNLNYVGGNPASPNAESHQDLCVPGEIQLVPCVCSLLVISNSEQSQTGNQSTLSCSGQDSITIFDLDHDQERELNIYCGQQQVPQIMSSTSYMRVLFSSVIRRNDGAASGFKFHYKFTTNFGINAGIQVNPGHCKFVFHSRESKSGNFTSPNYPGLYPRSTTCTYIFRGEQSEKVIITFNDLNVEGVGSRCNDDRRSDYITFSNFKGVEDRKMKPLCGRNVKGADRTSDGAFFNVTFKSNFDLEGTGFHASYAFVKVQTETPPTPEPTTGGSSTLHTSSLCTRLLLLVLCNSLVTIFVHKVSSQS